MFENPPKRAPPQYIIIRNLTEMSDAHITGWKPPKRILSITPKTISPLTHKTIPPITPQNDSPLIIDQKPNGNERCTWHGLCFYTNNLHVINQIHEFWKIRQKYITENVSILRGMHLIWSCNWIGNQKQLCIDQTSYYLFNSNDFSLLKRSI